MSTSGPPQLPDYHVRLEVDFEAGRWAGTLTLPPPLPEGALDLDCDGLAISAVARGEVPLPFRVEPALQRLHIPELGSGTSPLRVEFSGAVRPERLVGMYRCAHGPGHLLTTQCEPTGARHIVPCLDRPDRRARWHLTVRTRADVEVLGNMPGTPGPEDEGRREWTFEPTPPMASYLFYLGIGQFDRLESRLGPVAVRILGAPGRQADMGYSLEAGRRTLENCTEYFGLPYPLPKLDFIAVSEHPFGAMENWGAMSFREVRLLLDPGASTAHRRDVFETIAHEVAHQWFGNLVTLASWDDVWLNESFAAFIETRITERLAPELDAKTDAFLRIAGTNAAFEGDSFTSAHPVRAHVDQPEEISQIFDEITYGKGAAVLGMAEGYLGTGRFRAGVIDYLRRFGYGNARTEDLWESLARASGEPVAEILGPWVDRAGHPLLRVTTGDRELTIRQERFRPFGGAAEPPWPIPMVIRVNDVVSRLLFDQRERTLPIPTGAVALLNVETSGFYRVRYDEPMYERLFAVLPSASPYDRWGVVNDLTAFLHAGEVEWPLYERAVQALGGTEDRLVVESFAALLSTLGLLYPELGRIQSVVRTFFADRLGALGLSGAPGEPSGAGILRERLAFDRVRVDLAFARHLSELFPAWSRLDPNLRAAVAVARARTEGGSGWQELRRALDHPATEGERTQLERGLAWAQEPSLVDATLRLVEDGTIVRSHLVATLVQVAANPAARPILWEWLTTHMEFLDERFRGTGSMAQLLDVVPPLVGLGRGDAVRAYFRDHAFPEGTRGLAKGLERLGSVERLGPRLRPFA